MGVLNTIVSSSEARSPFFAPPFFSPSTKERSLSISPPGEQTRLELDKNICEKISFFFSSFLPIEKEKEENDFSRILPTERAYRLTFHSEKLGKKRIFTFDALGIVSFFVRSRRLVSSRKSGIEIRTRLVLGQPTG